MSCFPLPYGITDAQWHISHISGCITNTSQGCQRCNHGKGRHTSTHIYTCTQHTQHTHKVHLCIYSVVCAVQGTHTTCQASHIPCSTLQVETPGQAPTPSLPPGQLRMAVSLLVSLCNTELPMRGGHATPSPNGVPHHHRSKLM